jgi:hypothetical protein
VSPKDVSAYEAAEQQERLARAEVSHMVRASTHAALGCEMAKPTTALVHQTPGQYLLPCLLKAYMLFEGYVNNISMERDV